MNPQFNRTVAYGQIWLLLLWEAVGALYFDWAILGIFLVWFLAIFTLNLGVAIVIRTFIKLTQAPTPDEQTITPAITEDDGVV